MRRWFTHVGEAIGHPRIGGQAIASGAAGFLVALDVLGHVHMRHKAHVGFVDAHAKAMVATITMPFFTQKAVLVLLRTAPSALRGWGRALMPASTNAGQLVTFA